MGASSTAGEESVPNAVADGSGAGDGQPADEIEEIEEIEEVDSIDDVEEVVSDDPPAPGASPAAPDEKLAPTAAETPALAPGPETMPAGEAAPDSSIAPPAGSDGDGQMDGGMDATAEDEAELRRYIRLPFVMPIDFQVVSLIDGVPVDPEVRTGISQDLSEAGLCLQVTRPASAIATRLDGADLAGLGVLLDFALPKRALRVAGRLVWCDTIGDGAARRYHLGVEFSNLAEEDAKAILKFAKGVARKPRLVRATIATLAVAALAVGGLFLWGELTHRTAVGSLERELQESSKRHEDLAGSLERQTQELQEMAQDVRSLVETEGLAEDAGRVKGEGEAEDKADSDAPALLEALRKDIGSLQQTIAGLKEKVKLLGEQSASKGKVGKKKRGGKRKRRKKR